MILTRDKVDNYKYCEGDCTNCDLNNTDVCCYIADLRETLEQAWEELDRYKKEAERYKEAYELYVTSIKRGTDD